MASIKGIELKNIVEFLGHEQEPLKQASVFYKGKKVGFWSNDSRGGCDNFDLDYELPIELKKEINDIVDNYEGGILFKKIDKLYDKQYNITQESNYKQIGYEYLFNDLIDLIEHESIYKKYSKKWGLDTITIFHEDLFSRKIIGGNKVFNNTDTYFTYNSLRDFIVD